MESIRVNEASKIHKFIIKQTAMMTIFFFLLFSFETSHFDRRFKKEKING